MIEIKVDENIAGQRLDRYLRKFLDKASLGFIYKMIRKKNIVVNGAKAKENQVLDYGDLIGLYLSDETIKKFRGQDLKPRQVIDLDIVYEDDHILVVNKAKGLVSHDDGKGGLNLTDGINSYLKDHGKFKEDLKSTFRPGLAHRLDKNTSGLVLAGINLQALRALNQAFKEGEIKRSYRALVLGRPKDQGLIDKNLYRTEDAKTLVGPGGKMAQTAYKVLAYGEDYSLVDLDLVTGRTHQIRVHMASIGHPILGDIKYGDHQANQVLSGKYGIRNQVLHSYRLDLGDLQEPLAYLRGQAFEIGNSEEIDRIIGGQTRWQSI